MNTRYQTPTNMSTYNFMDVPQFPLFAMALYRAANRAVSECLFSTPFSDIINSFLDISANHFLKHNVHLNQRGAKTPGIINVAGLFRVWLKAVLYANAFLIVNLRQVRLRQPYQFLDDLLFWGISIDNLLQPLVPL